MAEVLFTGERKTITYTMTNADGTAFDLTNADRVKITAKYRLKDALADAIVDASGAITAPPTLGKVTYAWTLANTTRPGSFFVQLDAEDDDGDIIKTNRFIHVIRQGVRN